VDVLRKRPRLTRATLRFSVRICIKRRQFLRRALFSIGKRSASCFRACALDFASARRAGEECGRAIGAVDVANGCSPLVFFFLRLDGFTFGLRLRYGGLRFAVTRVLFDTWTSRRRFYLQRWTLRSLLHAHLYCFCARVLPDYTIT